jgi:hypothetical protein
MPEVAVGKVPEVLEILFPDARVDVVAKLLLDGLDALRVAVA